MQINYRSFLFFSFLLFISCTEKKSNQQVSNPPTESLDAVLNCGTKDSLIAKFGKDQLILDTVIVYHMDSLQASILYPNSPNQVEIFYKNDSIQDVKIAGESSQWKTDSGLYLGETLKEVQKANGKHFTISGFDWNYGGVVVSWEGGKLGGDELSHLAKFSNIEGKNGVSEEDYQQVKGEMEFDIRHEIIQSLNPILVEIALYHPRVPDRTEGKALGAKLSDRQTIKH